MLIRKIRFIYAIPFIFRFLVLVVTSSHPVTVSFFFSQKNGVVSPSTLLIVIFVFLLSSLPMSVSNHLDIDLYPKLRCQSDHIVAIYPLPPRKPSSRLVLCSDDKAVNGDRSCSNTTLLYPLLDTGGPPVKIRPGLLYDGAALIAPEGGNTQGIWSPPRCGHRQPVCCPRHNRLTT